MAPFRDAIRHLADKMQTCEEWLELVRDLRQPIIPGPAPEGLQMRWAEKRDLFAINALQGFVKETDFMEASLRKGDRCLLLEDPDGIRAFAWATFRDFKLAPWYTLKLDPATAYLVYIFVHPARGGRGVGGYLLGSLMAALRDQGGREMISGMYADWERSLRMHLRLGFRVRRRLSQCRVLQIFPTPPKVL